MQYHTIIPFFIVFITFSVIKFYMLFQVIASICLLTYAVCEEKPRFLIYDVNPGEGFNLRRDVYLRVANLVHNLNKDQPWILVVVPWRTLYHWKNRHLDQGYVLWSHFFDMESLRRYIPVIEFEDFLQLIDEPVIDQVYYLQHFAGTLDGAFNEKFNITSCNSDNLYPGYNEIEPGKVVGYFWGHEAQGIYARKFACMSYMATASFISKFLVNEFIGNSVLFQRAECFLHDSFGQRLFWDARRSMRFAQRLINEAATFRLKYLDSDDERDGTVLGADWREFMPERGRATGGPYLAVHLRRQDFLNGRASQLPSLAGAAAVIERKLSELGLSKVFIASDASRDEIAELKAHLSSSVTAVRFEPSDEQLARLLDGGVAIVDQIICAHARHFIGSYESTFSFRIHEEREILGLPMRSTFNRFCADADATCDQPAKWRITYDDTFVTGHDEL